MPLIAVRLQILAMVIAFAVAGRANGQTLLTLEDAMAGARARTPTARAADAAYEEAASRVRQARAGYLPRVDVSGSVQRGDQPVFVFSSLLSQRRFGPANFDVSRLNHPDPLTNIRSALTIEQPVFDGGVARLAVKGAELTRDLSALERTTTRQDLALAAARAFVRVLELEAADRATAAALAAGQSDLDRARARRDAGLVTDADVLASEVHLADMRQRQIATAGDLAVARVELSESVGLPLNETVMLVKPPLAGPRGDTDTLIREALRQRPDGQHTALQVELAANARRTARTAYQPTVRAQAGWEFNGSDFTAQRSGWIVGVQGHMNVFNGFADVARVAAARHVETRATAERERLDRRIEVEVRAAAARLDAARAAEQTGRAALSQARESQRIIRDRYDAGLTTVTDVLRAAEAVLDAESRAATAEMNVILQNVALDRAVGRL